MISEMFVRTGYGYDYICTTHETGAPCKLVAAQARWAPRPPQINYADALVLLRNGSSTTGLMYNRSSASAWFEYQDWDGKRHQVWSVPTMTLATDVTSTALSDADPAVVCPPAESGCGCAGLTLPVHSRSKSPR